ncbi:MAG: ImmA/IrrE family metallo-endopeptidase [Planctomycetota bacterium]|jgi:hypothetical protein
MMKAKVDNRGRDMASDVLAVLGMWRLPVDPFAVAKEEGIELVPGDYGEGFDARIEYLKEIERFAIYYQEPGSDRSDGRVRFSISHELGHYYLPHHRERLILGEAHDSVSDFRSDEPVETEADDFAANLLMPRELFVAEVRRFRQRVCDLADLCELAEKRLHTSLTSTARRYCEVDIEPCSVVFSKSGHVSWARHSEDMRRLGMAYIPFGGRVPPQSETAKLWAAFDDHADVVRGHVEPTVWYERSYYRKRLWEEAMPLGGTGIVLTLLVLEDEPE